MKKNNSQLFSIITRMQLADYYSSISGEVVCREANNLPFMILPNGIPCLIGNAYMLSLYERGLSRRNLGGTLRQYAGNISHIIRYCFKNNIDLISIDNNRFIHFINGLRSEFKISSISSRTRNSNTLNNIGRSTLEFLNFVGEWNGIDNFVVNAIKGYKKSTRIDVKNSKRGFIDNHSWHHSCFDTADTRHTRSPISKETIDDLYAAIPILSQNNHVNQRRSALLKLLEITGARIGELTLLKTHDVEVALQNSHPLLRIDTLKKRKDDERYVPVLKQDLSSLKAYLRIYRSKIIRCTIGNKFDHGYFFINEQNGKPLSVRYMGNEISLLRKCANISTKACSHMFRHRFITKLFVNLINQYNIENEDDFRRLLLDSEKLKQEIQQYTGHKRLSSLDIYIHLAFAEFTNIEKVVNNVQLRQAYIRYDECSTGLISELEKGMPVSVFIEKYRSLVELRNEDIDTYNKT